MALGEQGGEGDGKIPAECGHEAAHTHCSTVHPFFHVSPVPVLSLLHTVTLTANETIISLDNTC